MANGTTTDESFNRIIEAKVLPGINKALHSIIAEGYDAGLDEKIYEQCCKADAEFCKMKANELKITLPKYIDAQVDIIVKTRLDKKNDFFKANKNHPWLKKVDNSTTGN